MQHQPRDDHILRLGAARIWRAFGSDGDVDGVAAKEPQQNLARCSGDGDDRALVGGLRVKIERNAAWDTNLDRVLTVA